MRRRWNFGDGCPLAANDKPQPAKADPNANAGRPAGQNQSPKAGAGGRDAKEGEFDVFLLERVFPEAHELFRASPEPDPNADCLVAFDTNALLLPYSTKDHGPKDLAGVYSKLAESGRLYLPERVAREFIKNRDRKLADMVKAIGDIRSRVNIGESRISPLLEGLPEYEGLSKASKDLADARKSYYAALDGLSARIRSWRGNDPVASIYATLFTMERLIAPAETDDALKVEWAYRVQNKVPPGYKDGGKDDKGIGDFAIWMSLLNLGSTHKKDLIFVTGEEKADWFVRSGGERVYPRPELIDEYRRRSGGRTLRLSSLHDLLREMEAPPELVEDVEAAELTANSAILQASSWSSVGAFASSAHTSIRVDNAAFDYTTNDGVLRIERSGKAFEIRFSSSSEDTVHLYRSGPTRRIARVRKSVLDTPTSMDAQETSSRTYTIHVGEGFLVENEAGDVLAGRVTGIDYEGRNADRHEVRFDYAITAQGERVIVP